MGRSSTTTPERGTVGWVHASIDAPTGVASIVLDRPERRNALNLTLWYRLAEVAREVAADPAVRVVVIEGAGGHFCAGADVSEFGDARVGEATLTYDAATEAAAAAIEAISVPTVALVEGACLGGGVSIALAADVVLAAASARFGVPAASLGTLYPEGALGRLVRRVGDRRARWLLLGAERIGAEEAVTIGLAERVVDDRASGYELVVQMATLSSMTQQATKRVLADQRVHGELARIVFAAQDYAEGRRAFGERRAPRFMSSWEARRALEGGSGSLEDP